MKIFLIERKAKNNILGRIKFQYLIISEDMITAREKAIEQLECNDITVKRIKVDINEVIQIFSKLN